MRKWTVWSFLWWACMVAVWWTAQPVLAQDGGGSGDPAVDVGQAPDSLATGGDTTGTGDSGSVTDSTGADDGAGAGDMADSTGIGDNGGAADSTGTGDGGGGVADSTGTGDNGGVADSTGTGDEGDGVDGVGPGGPPLKVVPPNGHVPIGNTRQFRVVGRPVGLSWVLVAVSAPEAATLSSGGLLASLAGGWAIVGVADPAAAVVASTDTIWLAGGPTHIGARGGRVFASGDTVVCAVFPPGASRHGLLARIDKGRREDLPAQARAHGTPVAVYSFDVSDAQSGEDVGSTEGFEGEVTLTLGYDEAALPKGVAESDLVVASFDEEDGAWKAVPADQVVSVDRRADTITVGTTHASYWAVMDARSIGASTAVQSATWGSVKHGSGR